MSARWTSSGINYFSLCFGSRNSLIIYFTLNYTKHVEDVGLCVLCCEGVNPELTSFMIAVIQDH